MSKILFAVSGSIAGIKAASAVSQLVQKGHEVQVVTTPSALNFVGAATWEGLTGRSAISDIFKDGHQMDHIHLARWADVLILAPASANTIANWAHGFAGDIPSALFLAFERSKPVLLAPAMNKEMWSHPAVQANLATLKSFNVQILEPNSGALACGEIGVGRLVEAEQIVTSIENAARKNSSASKKVLITAGATREPLDGVRFITNFSTGKTGASLADFFFERGCDVTYLHGPGAALPQASVAAVEFTDFASLEQNLKIELQKNYDVVIQAAAVSDFSIEEIRGSDGRLDRGAKIRSNQDLEMRLKQNPKLVLNIKEWSRPHQPTVVAFKLTNTQDAKERSEAVDRLLHRPEIDAVVWNDLSEIQSDHHNGLIFWKDKKPTRFSTKAELAEGLSNGLSS